MNASRRILKKPTPVEWSEVDEEEEKRKRRSQVSLPMFGVSVPWYWIALALLIILGLVSFLYVTYIRHRREMIQKVVKLVDEEASRFPSCSIMKNGYISGTTVEPNPEINKLTTPTELQQIILELNAMTIPSIIDPAAVIKPENEWSAKAGLDWIKHKSTALENRQANAYDYSHKQAVAINVLNYRAKSASFDRDDSWSSMTGVFDIFDETESTRLAYRNSACIDSGLLTTTASLQLPFDTDYFKFLKRMDNTYSHKTWWK